LRVGGTEKRFVKMNIRGRNRNATTRPFCPFPKGREGCCLGLGAYVTRISLLLYLHQECAQLIAAK